MSIEEFKSKEKYDVGDLVEIMRILRSENGCPWDKEQTHESIRKNLIEETYEAVEAIDSHDMPLLREELGDVLLQVVFHARISEEEGSFDFSDVADEVCRKLIIRHPHIFSDVKADTAEQVLKNWDSIKAATKKQSVVSQKLDSVSRALPSLMRAQKIAGKIYSAGMSRSEEQAIGDMLFDISAYCARNGIDAEKALYDACERRISDVVAAEKKQAEE